MTFCYEWDQFLEGIREARERLGNPSNVWYRGQTESRFTLVPSLFRYTNGLAKERVLFEKYKQAAATLQSPRATDWETLFDMQHHYIPTRLLDWSGALGVAVFFALMRPSDEAAIFVLDPVALNRLSGVQGVKVVPGDGDFSYRSVYWDKKPFAPVWPIAIDPPFQNNRMLAQKGTFTIHGDNVSPIEEQCAHSVQKVVLPASARPGALEFLEYADINEYSIFPDMVGLAPFVKNLVQLH